MKKLLFLSLLLINSAVHGIEKGSSRAAVLEELGEPNGSMQRDGKEILLYKTGTVTLQNGAVIETDLSQKNARDAEERALKAKEIMAAKQAEMEKQKLLFPEDRIIRTGCEYRKTEDWNYLPPTVLPKPGDYQYDVYIPQGYYETDKRHYNCLILESPAIWDSVKERVRNEKWIVVILPNVVQPPIGQTMNGNFLAAYDDAVKRFRVSKEYIFIAGRVPAAIFATMRPAAGIILQEPDFSGQQKLGITLDFLRQNPNLCAYVLLSKNNQDKMHSQAQFIIKHIPKNYIGIYDGSTDILPQSYADSAFNWLKKQCNIP